MRNPTHELAEIDLTALTSVTGGGKVCQADVDFLNGLDPTSQAGRNFGMINGRSKPASPLGPIDDVGPHATQNNVNEIASGLSDLRKKLSGHSCP
jgi:hypothetical protein